MASENGFDQYFLPNLLNDSLLQKAIDFLNSRELIQMPVQEKIPYSGVYAIYYFGDYPTYQHLSNHNNNVTDVRNYYPIYVGKAVPRGTRTGQIQNATQSLYHRLHEHTKSIKSTNLDVSDFRCRFVIMTGHDEELIVPLESEMIRRYTPIWNSAMSGFGIHHPGSGRFGQKKSEWDTLHPGRYFAEMLTGELDLTTLEINEKVVDWLNNTVEDFYF